MYMAPPLTFSMSSHLGSTPSRKSVRSHCRSRSEMSLSIKLNSDQNSSAVVIDPRCLNRLSYSFSDGWRDGRLSACVFWISRSTHLSLRGWSTGAAAAGAAAAAVAVAETVTTVTVLRSLCYKMDRKRTKTK